MKFFVKNKNTAPCNRLRLKKNKLNKLIVILGPTAAGKSSLAVKLAKKFNGEVVSADSRQVYQGLDIGSGKITLEEMQGVAHHLLDVASPQDRFTAAQYQVEAEKVIEQIHQKKKVPFLCGGTGFYIQTVIDGLSLPRVKPNYSLRRKLEKLSLRQLHKMLRERDARRAREIDPKNKRRLVRALEIIQVLKKPIPGLKRIKKYDLLILGIKRNRKELKKLIHQRLLSRLKKGMIKEAERLHQEGVSFKRLEELGLEYRYLAYFLQGKLNKQEMIQELEKEIVRFAKRQMTWFRKDKRIQWIDNDQTAEKKVRDFLKGERHY